MQLGTKRRIITVLGNVTPLERFKVIVFLQVDHRRNTTTGLVCIVTYTHASVLKMLTQIRKIMLLTRCRVCRCFVPLCNLIGDFTQGPHENTTFDTFVGGENNGE